MDTKKTVWVVVLVVVIILAVALIARKSGIGGSVRPGADVLSQTQERIDINSGELVTKSLGEWENLGEKEGKYKNPTSGEYTMVNAIVCKACGQKIASPTALGKGAMTPCSKCGGNPFIGKTK